MYGCVQFCQKTPVSSPKWLCKLALSHSRSEFVTPHLLCDFWGRNKKIGIHPQNGDRTGRLETKTINSTLINEFLGVTHRRARVVITPKPPPLASGQRGGMESLLWRSPPPLPSSPPRGNADQHSYLLSGSVFFEAWLWVTVSCQLPQALSFTMLMVTLRPEPTILRQDANIINSHCAFFTWTCNSISLRSSRLSVELRISMNACLFAHYLITKHRF